MGGLTAIPLTAMLSYAEWLEMTGREADDLIRIIRKLDTRKLVLLNEKRTREAKKGK